MLDGNADIARLRRDKVTGPLGRVYCENWAISGSKPTDFNDTPTISINAHRGSRRRIAGLGADEFVELFLGAH
jgi:hypothetical protein